MMIAIAATILVLLLMLLLGLGFVIRVICRQAAQTHYDLTSGKIPPQIG